MAHRVLCLAQSGLAMVRMAKLFLMHQGDGVSRSEQLCWRDTAWRGEAYAKTSAGLIWLKTVMAPTLFQLYAHCAMPSAPCAMPSALCALPCALYRVQSKIPKAP